jgi:putative transposase
MIILLQKQLKEEIMTGGRPLAPLHVTDNAREQLQIMANSRTLPYALVRRAQIVLMSADGLNNKTIAEKVGLSGRMVGIWRQRFIDQGLMGLYDEPKPGGPRSISDEQVARLIQQTLELKPPNATHWSCRSIAKQTNISKSTVQRIWSTFGIQPHRQKHFTLSTDPFFVEKVRDIVGLYLNPPDKAMVLCVDEKSQIQALDRSQPVLPMGLGYLQGITHQYQRHGTLTLFAALDLATGEVIAQCKKRHRHQEFLQFLNYIEANVPKALDIHLVVDNYATHKHRKVKNWLAARPRYHVHYTPTYSSWLNQVEIWFNIITQKAIRRGSFRSVKQLIEKIDQFVKNYNSKSNPFTWTATADSILDKLKKLMKVIHGTQHYIPMNNFNLFFCFANMIEYGTCDSHRAVSAAGATHPNG